MKFVDIHIDKKQKDNCEMIVITKHEYDRLTKLRLAYGELMRHINKDELHQTRYVKEVTI